MRKKVWFFVSILLIGVMLLSACAQGGAPTEAPPVPTEAPAVVPSEAPVVTTVAPVATTQVPVVTTEAPAATTEAPAVTTEAPAATTEAPAATVAATEISGPHLTIWADETRAPIIQDLGKAFQDKYGVPIVVQQFGFGDIRDNMKTAAPAGEGPDIIIGAHDWLGELTVNGLLEPVDLGDKASQFLPAAIDAMTYDGKLYGMPYSVENVAFYRNTDLVPDAPKTWDEVEQIAAQLESEGKVAQSGYLLQQGDPYHFYPIMTAFGGYVFGRDAQGNYNPDDVGIDSEGSLAAAEWLDSMVKAGHLKAGVVSDDIAPIFSAGDAAMVISGPWYLPNFKEAGIPYAISNIPAGPAGEGQPFLGVQGFMVSAFSSDPLLAQAFLTEFVATEDVMQKLQEAGGRPSAYLPVVEKTTDPDLAAFAEAGKNGNPMPAIPEMSAVWTAWGDAITLIFQQQSPPDEAFKNAADQIRTLIAGGQ